ncbi:hypothetical protein [Scytonema millei]|uniref:Uncharacterized protein n=1 Tax=Scytonema millei VB511283 TaxID=1245923 RepID=A0A9X5E5S0_9CYAN|nr:hypothetical protein [Scytonema millei]NHC35451.1 hypothetical protein [Scytonema millei VB511283]
MRKQLSVVVGAGLVSRFTALAIIFVPNPPVQLSVVSYQLSVISYQLSVVSYQLSVISDRGVVANW